MDRFIAVSLESLVIPFRDLKSNMDRFIEVPLYLSLHLQADLKSNMDRFIGSGAVTDIEVHNKFKIQYG